MPPDLPGYAFEMEAQPFSDSVASMVFVVGRQSRRG